MTTQPPNDIQPSNRDRDQPDARAKTPGEAAAESLMRPIFPAPAARQAKTAVTAPRTSWFSVATVLTVIALAACAAAAVQAAYGPVFTQPLNGP
jgi:hypothetical protein